MQKKLERECKSCPHLWKYGIKDGKHDRWCCHFGKPAPEAFHHCKNSGYLLLIKKGNT